MEKYFSFAKMRTNYRPKEHAKVKKSDLTTFSMALI